MNALCSIKHFVCCLEFFSADGSYNRLGDLPAEISRLSDLKSVDVSHNQLARLPTALADLPGLAQLSCSNNRLTTLPNGLGQSQGRLARIDASHNVLTELPSTLSGATALTSLNLEENKIKEVPKRVLMGLASVVDLSMAKNSLGGCLWPDIQAMTSLRTMNLRFNQFTELPASLSGCVNLIELHMAHNKISKIAPEIGNLKSLKVISSGICGCISW